NHPMRFNFSRKIRSGYLAAFLLLLFSYILNINATLRLRDQNRWLDHTREVINKLELLISNIKDSEIGFRGFVMMKDEKFLLPYYTSEKKVDSIYAILHATTNDNSIQQERSILLKKLIDRKFDLLAVQLQSVRESHLEVNDFVRKEAFESKQI